MRTVTGPRPTVRRLVAAASSLALVAVGVAVTAGPAEAASPKFVNQTFSLGTLPSDWRTFNRSNGQEGWRFDDPSGRGNLTGGTGGFAIMDSQWVHSGGAPGGTGTVKANLETGLVNLSRSANPTLSFKTSYLVTKKISDATVYVTIDFGRTWVPVWSATTTSIPQATPTIALAPYIAGGPSHVRFRFQYHSFNGGYFEVDDVSIS